MPTTETNLAHPDLFQWDHNRNIEPRNIIQQTEEDHCEAYERAFAQYIGENVRPDICASAKLKTPETRQ